MRIFELNLKLFHLKLVKEMKKNKHLMNTTIKFCKSSQHSSGFGNIHSLTPMNLPTRTKCDKSRLNFGRKVNLHNNTSILATTFKKHYCRWHQLDSVHSTSVSSNSCLHRGFDILIEDLLGGFSNMQFCSSLLIVPKWN